MDGITTCDGLAMCADCLFRDTPDCDRYQDDLTDIGRGDDYAPNFWDLSAEEKAITVKDGLTCASAEAAKLAVIEGILADTQHKRSRLNPVFFLDAGDLCYKGI